MLNIPITHKPGINFHIPARTFVIGTDVEDKKPNMAACNPMIRYRRIRSITIFRSFLRLRQAGTNVNFNHGFGLVPFRFYSSKNILR